GADTVVVPAGTYVLTLTGAGDDAGLSGDLDVTADVDIVGAGSATTTLDGNGTDRVLDVGAGGVGHVSALTVTNGAGVPTGAGIRSAGTLTVTECVVHGNTASGEGETIGGASGGGIEATGPLVLERSTVSDNEAVFNPSPITASAGGGVFATQGTFVNSTISGNRALFGGGVATMGGTLVFSNTTIANNTVNGINILGTGTALTFRNTIVADNAGDDCSTVDGSWTTDGYNLDSDGTCGMTGTDQSGADPVLGP